MKQPHEFQATDVEFEFLAKITELCPNFTEHQKLTALFAFACLEAASRSETRDRSVGRVTSFDIISVAPVVAMSVFGEEPRDWLVSLGLDSTRKLGEAVFMLVNANIIKTHPGDRVEDFQATTYYDEYIQEGA